MAQRHLGLYWGYDGSLCRANQALEECPSKLSVDDFFFENDEEALRLEMSRNANNNATGDRGVEDRYQLHSLSTWDHLQ